MDKVITRGSADQQNYKSLLKSEALVPGNTAQSLYYPDRKSRNEYNNPLLKIAAQRTGCFKTIV